MRFTATVCADLCRRHGLESKRALGQNFLVDPNISDKIIRLVDLTAGEKVIEIGPGLGALTAPLAQEGALVTAVEKDRHIVAGLEDFLDQAGVRGMVQIVVDDAIDVDFAQLASDASTLVSNLPYNVAAKLILQVLEREPQIHKMVVMVQKEVGERLVAAPGTRTIGVPTVLASYWARCAIVADIAATVFLPQPEVASVLLRIDRTRFAEDSPGDYERLAQLVKSGYSKRRKMVRQSLKPIASEDDISAAGIELTARCEQLYLGDWLNLVAQTRGR